MEAMTRRHDRAALTAGALAAATVHAGPALCAWSPALRRALAVRDRSTDAGVVALTFDDGPHRGNPALAALARAGVCATFFLVGEQVERWPSLAAEIAAAGHEIAIHGHRHVLLLRRSPRALRADFSRAAEVIGAATGAAPRLYRPPYGVLTAAGLVYARRRGWQPLLWTRWGHDWRARATAGSIASEATADLSGGEVVLLHDADHYSAPGSWQRTVAALPLVVRVFDPILEGYVSQTSPDISVLSMSGVAMATLVELVGDAPTSTVSLTVWALDALLPVGGEPNMLFFAGALAAGAIAGEQLDPLRPSAADWPGELACAGDRRHRWAGLGSSSAGPSGAGAGARCSSATGAGARDAREPSSAPSAGSISTGGRRSSSAAHAGRALLHIDPGRHAREPARPLHAAHAGRLGHLVLSASSPSDGRWLSYEQVHSASLRRRGGRRGRGGRARRRARHCSPTARAGLMSGRQAHLELRTGPRARRAQRDVATDGQREAPRQRQAEPPAVDADDAAGLEDVLARIGPDAGPVVGHARGTIAPSRAAALRRMCERA
jgi:peptidoglycan/xylan/chitin deacetylase (PgdA/CDA1 family)